MLGIGFRVYEFMVRTYGFRAWGVKLLGWI